MRMVGAVASRVVDDWRGRAEHQAIVGVRGCPLFSSLSEQERDKAVTKGGAALRDFQERAIDSLMCGRHVTIAVSTGGGKTAVMLYAILHAALTGPVRIHVILMPLLSLQRDFMLGYGELSKRVVFFSVKDTHSANNVRAELVRAARAVLPQKSLVVLLSPEWLHELKDAFLGARDFLGFFCVDECHTVFCWETLRPDYAALRSIARDVPKAVFIAASATLLPEAERPLMVERLGLDPQGYDVVRVFVESRQQHVHYVECGELGLEAESIFGRDRMDMLVFVTALADLVPARTQIMRWSGLAEQDVWIFCSDMSPEYKAEVDDWLRARGVGSRVLVTTVAFGMGVDLATIKSVVLWTLPHDAASFFQALGRARPSADGAPLHLTVVLANLGKGDDMIKALVGPDPESFPKKSSLLCSVCFEYAPAKKGVPPAIPFTCASAGVKCRNTPRMPVCFQVMAKNFFSGNKDLLAADPMLVRCGVCDFCRGPRPVAPPLSVDSIVKVMAGSCSGKVGRVKKVDGQTLKVWFGGASTENVHFKLCVAMDRVPQFLPVPPPRSHAVDAAGLTGAIMGYFNSLGSLMPVDGVFPEGALKLLKKWRPTSDDALRALDPLLMPEEYQQGLLQCIAEFQVEKAPSRARGMGKKVTAKRNQENIPAVVREPVRKSARASRGVAPSQLSQYTTDGGFSSDED